MNIEENKSIKEQLNSGQIPTRQIYEDVPTEEIELPSKGKYYPAGHPLSSGKILLRYPTAKDEDILTSKNLIQKGTVIDVFLQSIIVDKSINLNDMLLGDKNALIIASRIMAYGKDYTVEIDCPSCSYKNSVVIDISQFEPKEVENIDSITANDFEVVLPASKATVRFKVLTQADDKQADAIIKQIKKSVATQSSPEVTTRLRLAILSVNGNEDRNEIKRFVDTMLTLDSKALRDEIYKFSPDVNMKFKFQCEECSYEEEMTMPIGISFFWPTSK